MTIKIEDVRKMWRSRETEIKIIVIVSSMIYSACAERMSIWRDREKFAGKKAQGEKWRVNT